MIFTLHEELEKQGPRTAPDPETAEEVEARRARRSRFELLGLIAAAGVTLLTLEEFGILELPEGLVLGTLALMTVLTIPDWFRTKDEDDDD